MNATSTERPAANPDEQLRCGRVDSVERTDAELLALIRAGDREAGEVFAKRHLEWAADYARNCRAGDLSEDVAQEVVMNMLARPPSDLRYSSAKPYLGTAIKRASTRARVRKPVESISRESRLQDLRTSPSAIVARLEPMSAAQRAIAGLPTPQRVVVRRRAEGLAYGEIASITGRSEATERSSHKRALERLRRELIRFLPPRIGR
jgi:RNA polymerase sigma factor (sigma-70 family)